MLPEWTDYNGHMNLAFYIHLFDSSWEVLLEKFNIGESSAKNEKRTTFAVESRTTYDMEVKVGDHILFGKWSGTEATIDGVELLIMQQSDIMGIIE